MYDSLPSTGFVRLPVILRFYPVGKTTWWCGVRSGKFPAGHKLSAKVTAWRAEEIRELIEKGGTPVASTKRTSA